MNRFQQCVAVSLTLLATQFTVAHEGVHGAGQVHVGDHHMGMLEVSLAVLVMIAAAYGLFKAYNSRK